MTASRVRANDYMLPARYIYDLLNYVEVIGLDVQELAARVGLNLAKLSGKAVEDEFPAIYYSSLYLEMVKTMEARHPVVPWAGGMGTAVFRMLWYCLIHCRTLGEALERAEEFHSAVYRLTGHRVWLRREAGRAVFEYRFDTDMAPPDCAPAGWERSLHLDAVAQSSGLKTWCSMLGWSIGHSLELDAVHLAIPRVTDEYHAVLETFMRCQVQFDTEVTAMWFSANQLENRIVQTPNSLVHFLGHAIYQYWMEDPPSDTTSMAIKSLISGAIEEELPRFSEIADRLHMSTSTLRRRLMEENTTYQLLKDECREAAAIEHLHKDELKIHEIAERLRFSETSSFVRAFRKWTGMTPHAYRERAQKLSLG